MRQLVRSWMNLHTKTSCCCWGQNVSLPLVLFVFLQPCQRSASLEQLPFQSVPASCSLILQLCLLCTFRHYSFSPGSEPCKLRESPSTHTHTQIHGNQSCQISTSEACKGRGAVGAQAFLFSLFFTVRRKNVMIYSSGTHTKNMVLVQQEAIVNPLWEDLQIRSVWFASDVFQLSHF